MGDGRRLILEGLRVHMSEHSQRVVSLETDDSKGGKYGVRARVAIPRRRVKLSLHGRCYAKMNNVCRAIMRTTVTLKSERKSFLGALRKPPGSHVIEFVITHENYLHERD